MSEIDWSKAPEWARGCWTITEDERFVRHHFVQDHNVGIILREAQRAEYIPRQTAWNGEGLPPVGVECEFVHPGIRKEGWQTGVVKAYFDDRVVIKSNYSIWDDGIAVILIDTELEFRPLKTPEQKQREELAELIMDSEHMTHDATADAILAKYTLAKK